MLLAASARRTLRGVAPSLVQALETQRAACSSAAALRPATHHTPFPSSWTAAVDAADAAPPPPEEAPPPGGPAGPASTTTTPAPPLPALDDTTDPAAAAAALTPKAVVAHLDRHIVGQADAKRAVANALRTRWRRHRVSPASLREEIVPKNILMVGPTGSGKTAVAKRLAKLAAAPFIKVEATKFTEVGFHGRDVDQIIRDLVDNAILLTKERARARAKASVAAAVEARLLGALCGEAAGAATLDTFRALYRAGALDDRTVVLDLPAGMGGGSASPRGPPTPASNLPPGLSSLDPSSSAGVPAAMAEVIARVDRLVGAGRNGGGVGGMLGGVGGSSSSGRTERRELTIGEARPLVEDAEADRLVNQDDVIREALASTQSDGIVFIDEIDKIVVASDMARYGADASSTGVQRDLLPLLDGSVVPTKYGPIATDHILFIASGAFHTCKPSDMLAELQGRLPIRVELKGLNAADFYRILTEPESNLITQQAALLATEGLDLHFTEGAIREVARIAEEVNTAVDNIGARRLHTIIERILEEVSFDAPETAAAGTSGDGEGARVPGGGGGGPAAALRAKVVVDEGMVRDRLASLLEKQDLSRFVL